jgi:hypothetical protein
MKPLFLAWLSVFVTVAQNTRNSSASIMAPTSPTLSVIDYKDAGPDISYWIKAALADKKNCPSDSRGYSHCSVVLPSNDGTAPYAAWTQTVTVTSPFVSIIGAGKSQSYFYCTAIPDCLRIYTLPFTAQTGGTFKGFSLQGGGGNGIHIGDITGVNLIDLGVYSFAAPGSAGIWLDNANLGNLKTGTYTERTLMEGVELNDNHKNLRFSTEVQPGNKYGGNPSFGYTRILDLKTGSILGQTDISLEGAAQVYSGTIRCTANTYSSAAVFSLTGTSQFQGELHLSGEGTSDHLFFGASGTLLTLTQDSSVGWLGTSSPPSTLGVGSGIILGTVQGIATRGPLVSLVPDLPIISMNALALPSGSTGITQNPGDNSTKIATDAFVLAHSGPPPLAPRVTIETSGKSAIYTTPPETLYLVVEMCGPGGGGAGSGIVPGGGEEGSAATVFGVLSAGAGKGGFLPAGGAGGAAYGGDINITGAPGGGATHGTANQVGSQGGSSPFGGAGEGGSGNGGDASANSCSGGGGAGAGAAPSAGPGGGAGAYLRKLIASPASSYSYTVGNGGHRGTLGTHGFPGGAGGSGIIVISAYFR